MVQLLVCVSLCLLHLALGVAIGARLRGNRSLAIVAEPDGGSQFVRLEVQRLAHDWAAIRLRLDQFLSFAAAVDPIPREFLRGPLADITDAEFRLQKTLDRETTEPVSVSSAAQPVPAIKGDVPILTNGQIDQLFDTDRNAEAAAVRYRFPVKQPMAPIIEDLPPAASDFRLTQCHDLSVREVRFFEEDRPCWDRIVIGFGKPKPVKWVVAEIVDYRTVVMYGRTGYLVTAQFVAGLDTYRLSQPEASVS